MKTTLNYLKDSYNFEDKAIILGTHHDDIGNYILLDKTIFYPQGGGQPSDTGQIQIGELILKITSVKIIEGEVRHYSNQDNMHIIDKEASLAIDQSKRILHAKLHTAGHLISNIIERSHPNLQAIKGHHYPDLAYVEFIAKGNVQLSIDDINNQIIEAINNDYQLNNMEVESSKLAEICPNLPFNVPSNKILRVVRIGNFPYSPCGGTHIKSTKELAKLKISKIKAKNNNIKVTYEIN